MHAQPFMDEALKLALHGIGKTSPNPSVGAVIVRDGKTIARGCTGPCGSDHAEVAAIKHAEGDVRGSEMYVTLEPCCHYGKTPPCTNAIIEAGIRAVHIPMLDPNPRVSGKGVIALREAGVEVIFHPESAPAAADLIRPFKKYILRKRPFVVLKLAISLDGHTATSDGNSKWISNDYSRYMVHRMRSLCDGVMVGKNTVLVDDPALTVRYEDFSEEVKDAFRKNSFRISGRDNFLLKSLLESNDIFTQSSNPVRILFGLPETNHAGVQAFKDTNYLIFEKEGNRQKLLDGRKDVQSFMDDYENGRLIFLPDMPHEEEISAALDILGTKGMLLVLLEGGAKLAGAFLNAGEIDQFAFFIAPKIFGNGRPAIEGRGAADIAQTITLKDASTVTLKGDILFWGYSGEFNFESF